MMKQLLCAAAICMISLATQSQEKVLFLGNSYTFFNNMPEIFKQFSDSAGHSPMVQSNTPGGYTLQGHSTNAQSLNMIQQGDWNYVVLQEQSQIPSFPINQVQNECFPYASQLDATVNQYNHCAETVFFMTWGRENGDANNCAVWPPVCTYEGMDSLLYERYMQMADDNDALVSPVGAVWRFIRENMTQINLYDADGSHPSPSGSYAAACAFYTIIYREDPTLVSWNFSLNPLHAYLIREATKAVVYDSLSKWHVGEYDSIPSAGFTHTQIADSISFTNTSTTYNDQLWLFGDGDSSTAVNPSHVYDSLGTFNISLISYYCLFSDTDTLTITIDSIAMVPDTNNTDTTDTTVFIPHLGPLHTIQTFPIPASDIIMFSGVPKGTWASVYDLRGQIIRLETLLTEGRSEMSLEGLSSGSYFVRFRHEDQASFARILIE